MRWGSGGEVGLMGAARRAMTEFNIIMNGHGGLVNREFEQSMRKLELMIEREEKKDRNPELAGGTDGSADV